MCRIVDQWAISMRISSDPTRNGETNELLPLFCPVVSFTPDGGTATRMKVNLPLRRKRPDAIYVGTDASKPLLHFDNGLVNDGKPLTEKNYEISDLPCR